MTLTDSPIIEQLEILAAAFPWEPVSLHITRFPDGLCSFMAVMEGKAEMGLQWECASGETPAEAVQSAIERFQRGRDPETMRNAAVREMEEKIRLLKAVVIGLPPYRPGTYIEDRKTEIAQAIDV